LRLLVDPVPVVVALQTLEADQDLVLDDMSSALERLGAMSQDINKELKTQAKYVCWGLFASPSATCAVYDRSKWALLCCRDLDALNNEVTDAQETMKIVLSKIQKLLGTSGTLALASLINVKIINAQSSVFAWLPLAQTRASCAAFSCCFWSCWRCFSRLWPKWAALPSSCVRVVRLFILFASLVPIQCQFWGCCSANQTGFAN
jgi:hypothetical protein